MNLTQAVKVSMTDAPTERVTLDIGSTTISLPAADVAQLIIDKLMRTTAPRLDFVSSLIAPPKIGALWSAEGGFYAGIVCGDDGQPDYHLVVAEASREKITWKDAGEWAKEVWLRGFRDYTLPKRREQAVLYGNVPELFVKEWYWSCEEYAGDAEYAWCQTFNYGTQDLIHKDTKLRARAVRRVPIE